MLKQNLFFQKATKLIAEITEDSVSLLSEAILGSAVPAKAACSTYACQTGYRPCGSCGADKKQRVRAYCPYVNCVGSCCVEVIGCAYC